MVPALKSASALLATFLVAALVASCGAKDTHGKIMEDTFGLMEKVVAAIEQVKDQETAKAAARTLDDMVSDFEEVAERNAAIGEPDEATEKALKEKYNKRGEELMHKMMSSMLAVATKDPGIMKTLQAPMEKIGNPMDRVKVK